jgi:hypothetical protein
VPQTARGARLEDSRAVMSGCFPVSFLRTDVVPRLLTSAMRLDRVVKEKANAIDRI